MRTNTLFLALVLSVVTMTAQTAQPNNDALKARFGLFVNVDYGIHSASFQQLPGVANCCTEFTGATDLGFLGGLSYIKPFDETLGLHLRMHYWAFSAPFSETATLPVVDLAGGPAEATIQHDLTASFQQISLEPLLAYHLSPDFALLGGLTLGGVFSATYDQKETLVTPEGATFETGSRERNALSGDIPDASVFALGITVGATFDVALNSDRTVFMSPEVLFTANLLPVVSDVTWSRYHLRAGLAFSFVPPEIEDDTLSELELYQFARSIEPPRRGQPGVAFQSGISAVGIGSDGRESEVSQLRIEEFSSTRVRPLLPYVFFDERSATLPARYRQLSEEQRDNFAIENFYNLDAMVTYYHLLNVVGKRMSDDPSATIALTGCTDPSEGADGTSLAQDRANAVKKYLTSTWNIDASRISSSARSTPEKPSNVNEADGRVENRRVELSSSSASILAAVESKDTMRVVEPAGIRFRPSIDPKVPIASWTMFVSNEGSLVKTFHGGDPVPSTIDWRPDQRLNLIPRGTKELQYLVAVTDSNGAVIPSATKTIPITEVTLADKTGSGRTDKTVDRYSLILFGFDSAELSADNQALINNVKGRIGSNASTKVIGYTDRTGSDDYNRQLSDRRAKSVARALGVPESTAQGVGESFPLYDNDTPEGRFYSRTVEVLVETPRN